MKTVLWGLVSACAYLCISVVEGAQLQVVEIQPCSVISGTVSDSYSITYAVHANFSLCNNYDTNGSYVSGAPFFYVYLKASILICVMHSQIFPLIVALLPSTWTQPILELYSTTYMYVYFIYPKQCLDVLLSLACPL